MNLNSVRLPALLACSTALCSPAVAVTIPLDSTTNLSVPSEFVSDAGDATVTVEAGATLIIAPLCAEVDAAVGCYQTADDAAEVGFNSSLTVRGDDEGGGSGDGTGDGRIIVGNNGSDGAIAMYQGGLTAQGANAGLTLGNGSGSTGNLFVGVAFGDGGGTEEGGGTASSVTVAGQDNASLVIGADGGTGLLSMGPGTVSVTGTTATVEVGAQADSSGRLELLGFNTMFEVTGGVNPDDPTRPAATMFVGEAPGSEGAVYVDGGNLVLGDTNNYSELFLGAPEGRSQTVAGTPTGGGYGTLEVVGGGFVFANSIYVGASAENVGLGAGGTGEMLVSGSGVNSYEVGFGADAELVVEERVSQVVTDELYIGAVETPDAGGGQSTGTVTIANGGEILAASTDGEGNRIGSLFVGSGGTLNIRGENSRAVFSEAYLGGGDGAAFIDIDDGGTLDLGGGDLWIGSNGTLWGDGGTINGNVILDGGTLAPGNSPGEMTILGGFQFLSGIIQLEVEGTDEGQFDVLNIIGDLFGELTIDFLIGDGVDLAGTALNMLNIAPEEGGGDTGQNPVINFLVNGQAQQGLSLFSDAGGGGFAFGGTNIYETQDPGGPMAPVPLPAGMPLLLAGLGSLALLRRARRAA